MIMAVLNVTHWFSMHTSKTYQLTLLHLLSPIFGDRLLLLRSTLLNNVSRCHRSSSKLLLTMLNIEIPRYESNVETNAKIGVSWFTLLMYIFLFDIVFVRLQSCFSRVAHWIMLRYLFMTSGFPPSLGRPSLPLSAETPDQWFETLIVTNDIPILQIKDTHSYFDEKQGIPVNMVH